MRSVKEIDISLYFSPLNVNLSLPLYLCNSIVETSVAISHGKLFKIGSMSMKTESAFWESNDSDTDVGFKFSVCTGLHNNSFGLSVFEKNTSFNSSAAFNL